MKTRIALPTALLAILIGMIAPQLPGDETEQEVAREQIPENVRLAAEKAVDGIQIEDAEVEAVLIFELEGKADGKEIEIEVTAEGQVLKSEGETDNEDAEDAADNDDSRAAGDADDSEKGETHEAEVEELEIPVSAIPATVLAAAQKAFSGFEPSEADVEPELVYELEGTANGVEYELEVTSDGEVLAVEKVGGDDK
jgi:hypothetical protein